MKSLLPVLGLLALIAGTTACRGGISEEPPLHPVLDMDFQAKRKAQSESLLFSDGRAMRTPPKGTIARGHMNNGPLNVWKNPDGSFVAKNPLEPSEAVLARGQQRFNINCSPCHGRSGRGGIGKEANGTVGRRWGAPIPSFIDHERVSLISDGEIFDVITAGRGTMPAYNRAITVEDRWSIIHYIRALQYQAENQ